MADKNDKQNKKTQADDNVDLMRDMPDNELEKVEKYFADHPTDGDSNSK